MIRLLLIVCTVAFSQQADHILLTRIVTQPNTAESLSIYNPTNSSIDLTHYYICDDKEYYKMQTEGDMSPSSINSGFTVQFPAISIEPYDTLTIVLHADYKNFYGEDFVPDIVMFESDEENMIETNIHTCSGGPNAGNPCEVNEDCPNNDGDGVKSCVGSIGIGTNKIKESSELIILFKWDGNDDHLIEDIDYFVWTNGGTIVGVDKTGIGDYLNDTSLENQIYFEEVAEQNYAYSRIGTDENSEIVSGGNGIYGDDETSENFQNSWEIRPLFNLGCTDENAPNFDPMAEKDDDTCVDFSIKQIYDQYGSELSPAPCNDDWTPGRDISTMGLIIDYQVTGGPRVITIEDDNGYRLDAITWDWDPLFSDKTRQFVDYYDPTEYIVLITGSLGIYNCNFQLEINSEDDITYFNSFHPFGDFKQDHSIVAAKIEPAPFVLIPTLGEHLDFSYSFPENSRVIIRVFDISGRFITSIVDRYFDQAGKVDRIEDHSEWDGRDHLGQIVAPGTYIMHIEALNPVTGETHTDAAPVVVGVKN